MAKVHPATWCALLIAAASVGAAPKVLDYRLDITFEPHRSDMQGNAMIRFDTNTVSGDSVTFYLHGELTADSLYVDGRQMTFDQNQVRYPFDYSLVALRVSLAMPAQKPQRLTVHYSGYFHPSAARSPSDYMRIDNDGVFLRAYGYSLWFPLFLEAGSDSYNVDFSEVTIRTPAEYIPVFVGERISEETTGSQRVSRWGATQQDLHAPQCTAQRFAVCSERDLYLYYYSDTASTAMAGNILKFVRRLNAEYAAKYRKVASVGQSHVMEMPPYGDISSGNVTGITSGIWQQFETNEWSQRALAHELVHPFVQTDTKRSDSLYALEIEGFPSFFHLPILAELFGEDWYEQTMRETEAEYLKKRQTGLGWRDRPLPKEKPLSQISADEVGVYKDVFVLDDRALLFLNWLYRKMGKDQFFEFTQSLFTGAPVTYGSFRELILKWLPKAGADLNLWLNTTEFPYSFRLPRR